MPINLENLSPKELQAVIADANAGLQQTVTITQGDSLGSIASALAGQLSGNGAGLVSGTIPDPNGLGTGTTATNYGPWILAAAIVYYLFFSK